MNAATRLAFSHLKSFRREDGAPYGQYAWIYSRVYGTAMRALHRCGRHWFRQRLGGRYCNWCGAHAAD